MPPPTAFFKRKNLGKTRGKHVRCHPTSPAGRRCASPFGTAPPLGTRTTTTKKSKPRPTVKTCVFHAMHPPCCGKRCLFPFFFSSQEDAQSPALDNVSTADARRPIPARHFFFVGRSFRPQSHRPLHGLDSQNIVFPIIDSRARRMGPLKVLSRICGFALSRRPQMHARPDRKKNWRIINR